MPFARIVQTLVIAILAGIMLQGCFAGKGKYSDKELVLDASYYFQRGMQELAKRRYDRAIEQFTTVTESFSGSAVVDSAMFYLAEAHYKNEEYLTAAYEYERVFTDYPSSKFVAEAQYKKALAYSMESPRANLDQENTQLAIDEFVRFIENNPGNPLTHEAQTRIDELTEKLAYKDYLTAELYRKMKSKESLEAALIYYRMIIDEYPRSLWRWYSQYGIGVVLHSRKEFTQAKEVFDSLIKSENAPAELKRKSEGQLRSIEANAGKP